MELEIAKRPSCVAPSLLAPLWGKVEDSERLALSDEGEPLWLGDNNDRETLSIGTAHDIIGSHEHRLPRDQKPGACEARHGGGRSRRAQCHHDQAAGIRQDLDRVRTAGRHAADPRAAFPRAASHDLACRVSRRRQKSAPRRDFAGPWRVLFLDELPEFDERSLEAMLQPLEDHIVTIKQSVCDTF